ncbi:MAG: nicotinamide-nucleotide adenylyltransferase [Massilia sp.]|jgi:NadR type nicotinamide-nucleotide adenylyltransferase|nr:nicotinamide-nucleotide adenylyltransferase [Massilia sp.]
MNVLKVAILGAESTGKSTLTAALAARYDTAWVPEYLREFVETHARVPFEDDQPGIARTQLAREAALAPSARRLLFCDTTPLMTAVYSDIYWGRVPPALDALALAHDYAVTMVAAPDGPWIPDGLQRESAQMRRRVHEALLARLRRQGIDYSLLTGDLQQRLAQAAPVLARLL